MCEELGQPHGPTVSPPLSANKRPARYPLLWGVWDVCPRGGQTWGVIVGLLLVAALLVDRFVLLPAFEDGEGSTAAAVLAWLGVNLLPAFAWLAIKSRDQHFTRSQLAAGTLAVIATTAILIVPVLIWWAAR